MINGVIKFAGSKVIIVENNTHSRGLSIRYFFRAFVLASVFSFSLQSLALELALDTPNREAIQQFISDVRKSRLDYLENEKSLKEVFNVAKEKGWNSLHAEAAALYSELLFRQEKYSDLTSHLQYYLDKKEFIEREDIHLLFLETKLKSLTLMDDPAPAQALAKKLEVQLSQHSNDEKITIYRALAYYYTADDALRKTLKAALDGLELAMQTGDVASQGYFYRKIADAYTYLSENDKGIYYAKKAVSTFEKTNDGLFTAKAYWSLGNILLENDDTPNALLYLHKALAYFEKVNMKKGLAFAQYSIANVQYLQGNLDEALQLAQENIELARASGIHDMQLASMILLSNIYIEKGNLEVANQINDDVFNLIEKFSRSIYKAEFFGERYELKRKINHVDEAFEALEKKLFFINKHYEATSESNIKALQVKFEVKEKEDEIRRLEYQKNISELQAKEEYQQKIIWRLSAAIAFILVLVALLLFYRQVRQRKKYHRMASTDHLSNCLNRRGILNAASVKLAHHSVSIAIVDLDYFKKINDEYGHDIGDMVLIAFANAAKDTLPKGDEFGRYGGEEWLFVLNSADEKVVRSIFQKLAVAFQKYCDAIEAFNPKKEMTFSVGATLNSKSPNSLDSLIKRADTLLYRAKENGRNQVVID